MGIMEKVTEDVSWEWEVKSGELRVESGEWRVESRYWRVQRVDREWKVDIRTCFVYCGGVMLGLQAESGVGKYK